MILSIRDTELRVPLWAGRPRRPGPFLPERSVRQDSPGLSSSGGGPEAIEPAAGPTVGQAGSECTPLHLHRKTSSTLLFVFVGFRMPTLTGVTTFRFKVYINLEL